MAEPSSRAIVPVGTPALPDEPPKGAVTKLGEKALSLWGRSPAIRKAALAGAAFGLGYQISRMASSGTLPQLVSEARDAYRVAAGDDPGPQGVAGRQWVRGSVTIISAVYGFLEREDR